MKCPTFAEFYQYLEEDEPDVPGVRKPVKASGRTETKQAKVKKRESDQATAKKRESKPVKQEDTWHLSVRFAYLAGGVCDSVGVRNALLRRREMLLNKLKELKARRYLSVEELRDRLLQAMEVFVVRKERATTTRQFKSKVSVTFTRRRTAGGADDMVMTEARRVVAGVCQTLEEAGPRPGAGLVPC
nr:hypothetical protein BaRGS_024553 [Batillaria attramentaria]